MGGELAARYLANQGHRRVAVLTGPPWSSDSRLRVAGFRTWLRQKAPGVQVTVLHGDYHEEPARHSITQWLQQRPSTTALFCCNDLMAFGALRALRERGRSCPKDLSIVGYDDDPRAERSEPPLTTIRVPTYEIARAGATRLVQHLLKDGRGTPLRGQMSLPVELVERASVRRCR